MTTVQSIRPSGASALPSDASTQTTSRAVVTDDDGSLLEDSDFCGDPLFELQALMADMNLKDKQDAREARNFEEAGAEQALQGWL